MATPTEIIDECFNDLENSVPGLVISHGSIIDRFAALKKACENKEIENRLIATLRSRVVFHETLLTGVPAEEMAGEIVDEAFRIIFYTAGNHIVKSYLESEKVRRQHWIPHCFVKKFAEDDSTPKKRKNLFFTATSVDSRGEIQGAGISDSDFIHNTVRSDNGRVASFYDDSLESFFTFWESRYGEVLRAIEGGYSRSSAFDMISAYIFSITLEERKRNSDGGFTVSTLPHMIELLCAKAEVSGHKFVEIVQGVKNRVFSTVQGTQYVDSSETVAEVHPLSSTVSAIVTSVALPAEELASLASMNQESIIGDMKNGNITVYGMPIEEAHVKVSSHTNDKVKIGGKASAVVGSGPSQKIFNRLFQELAETVGLRQPGSTMAERVAKLSQACQKNVSVSELVSEISAKRFNQLRLEMKSRKFDRSATIEGLDEKIITLMFYLVIDSLSKPGARSISGQHQHWVPMCFMRQWSEPNSRNISKLDVVNGLLVETVFDFKNVAHKKVDGKLLYSDELKDLFFALESWYGNIAPAINAVAQKLEENKLNPQRNGSNFNESRLMKSVHFSAFNLVMIRLFCLMNEIRKPDENGEFKVRTIEDFMMEFCRIFDRTSVATLRFDLSDQRSLLTLVRNDRVFVNRFGARLQVFPVTPLFSLVCADREVSQNETRRAAERHREVTVKQVMAGKLSVLGVSKGQL